MAIFVIPVAGAGFAAAAVLRRIARRRRPSIVLVGPARAGKTTLARLLAADPEFRETTATPVGQRYWRRRLNGPDVAITDLPGADALRAWHDAIKTLRPPLVCLVADFARLSQSNDDLRQAELAALHVRSMVRKGRVGIVLTHLDEAPRSHPDPDARTDRRVRLLAERLGTDFVTVGSLIQREKADRLVEEVLSWLP